MNYKVILVLYLVNFYNIDACIFNENIVLTAMSNYRISFFRDKINDIFTDRDSKKLNNCEFIVKVKRLLNEIIHYAEDDISNVTNKTVTF